MRKCYFPETLIHYASLSVITRRERRTTLMKPPFWGLGSAAGPGGQFLGHYRYRGDRPKIEVSHTLTEYNITAGNTNVTRDINHDT